ncbi:MAG: hypothetical protein ACPG5P_03785, partial [Saprospiraceae bacterium]
MFASCSNSLPQGFLEKTQAVEIEILTGDGTPILVFESSRPNDLDRVKGVVSRKKAPLYKCAHTG